MQIIVELHKSTHYSLLELSPSCYITLQHTTEQHTMLHLTTEYYEVPGNTLHILAYYDATVRNIMLITIQHTTVQHVMPHHTTEY